MKSFPIACVSTYRVPINGRRGGLSFSVNFFVCRKLGRRNDTYGKSVSKRILNKKLQTPYEI